MKCNFCEWRCDLSKGSVCGNYIETEHGIEEKRPYFWSRIQPQTSEHIPVFHLIPDGRFLQIGGFSCNAACAYCINASLAIEKAEEQPAFKMSAEQIVDMAIRGEYAGIHFGINEVAVNLPSALKIAAMAKEKGLITGCSSNGFFTEESLMAASEVFDFFNISLKALDDEFYKQELGLFSVAPIKRNIRYLAEHNHLELTTPIVSTMGEREVLGIADFIASINRDIPWHVFRLLPEHEMAEDAPPDIDAITPLIIKAKEKLNYIYWGNFIASKWVDTVCPVCGETVIERLCEGSCGARFLKHSLQEGSYCPACGYKLPVKGF